MSKKIEHFYSIRTTAELLNMNLWLLLDVRDSADPKIVIPKDVRTQSEDMGKSNVGPCFKALKLLKCFKIRSFINI